MDIRKVKWYWMLLLLPLLMGCPWKDDCPDKTIKDTTIEDLITISPFKNTFERGEIVVFELIIPDSVFVHDSVVSLYGETGDAQPQLITDNRLFLNNTLEFEYGYQGDKDNWFHLEYLPGTKEYTLKIFVKFSKIGDFELANASSRIIFKGKDKCEWYEIRTNIKEFQGLGHWVTYTVIP